MIKKASIILFLLFSSVIMIPTAYAKDGKCTYTEQAELNKLAANVTASYEIIKGDNGNNLFKISIYNITKDIYVLLSSDNTEAQSITSDMTNNGIYSFNIDNETDIITYTITVRGFGSDCINDIRKFTLIKPRRNKYHDYNECQYAETESYSYCLEWVTTNFSLPEEKILERIESKRNSLQKIKTTAKPDNSNEIRYQAKLKQAKLYKKIIVAALSTAIALDIIYIYIKISNIRRSAI